ncbi:ZYRO0F01782p [Zygosaccharomyces rouxii]|uniref:ZYRO0F01782p n=1 Tax=Zygosaccharomyces rouxii (strain ATCC 2623 / CBS 732 / NBRC 1130 / NCYC 568 / NRRL Y-229) TaxID=559307 RepID=C5DX30_ZYGRC|nr:uncharacterized protein ZYRO0F01782g [Zygosaccharomyces rouxii]KAH9199106.1 putative zinc finger motif, C2HC5-type-domain-containing protein [Zygosaccharomyces rouxii]CAR28341.1 ZYRO0F01782p [Zygosaccharomyces rouxii]
MTKLQAVEYAVIKIPDILPLQESEVRALCDQLLTSSNGNPDRIAEGFLDILGHSDLSFDFVIGFNNLLSAEEQKPAVESQPKIPPPKESKKPVYRERSTPSLPSEHLSKKNNSSNSKSSNSNSNNNNTNSQDKKNQKEKKNQKGQLLREIEQVSKFLEQEPNPNDVQKFACNCQGSRHPLFEAAPNCLSCGKIICIREGLHLSGCSHCGQDFISLEERFKILQLLKQEKEELENGSARPPEPTEKQRAGKNKAGKSYKISTGIGTNLFTEQDKLFDLLERQKEREKRREKVLRTKEDEQKQEEQNKIVQEREASLDPELAQAQDRLDKLLYFQDTSAERTKIIDNVSDFSMANDSNQWGSARERALMLKKQQRNLRKWQKLENERNGRRDKYVVSMDIGPNGKVTMKEVHKDRGGAVAHSDEEISDVSDEEDARDLKTIHALKDEIESDRRQKGSKLESNTWDYERDKKQFKRPVYIGKDTEDVSKSAKQQQDHARKPRVQADGSDEHFWDKLV